MSAAIVQRVVSGEYDNRLVLKNCQAARKLSFGSNWEHIRIGLRCAVQGTTTFTPFRYFIGISSGTTNLWASEYCQHSLGFAVGASGGTTATYSSSNGGNYNIGNVVYAWSRISQTEKIQITPSIASGNVYLAAKADDPTSPRNCAQFFDIKRNGAKFDGSVAYGSSTSSTYANKSYALVRDAMLAPTIASAASTCGVTVGFTATTVDDFDEEANGKFDSVFIYWKHNSVGFEISDLMVSRIL